MKYHLFVGIYDHKLGPICALPTNGSEYLKNLGPNATSIIQDGLNTKSKILTLKKADEVIQIFKFNLTDSRLRGSTLRCCIFCIVPKRKPLLLDETLMEIAMGFLEAAKKNDNSMINHDGDIFLEKWETQLNTQLAGESDLGQIEHRKRELLNGIIGYSELLSDGVLGTLNEEQKDSILYIMKYAKDLLDLEINFCDG